MLVQQICQVPDEVFDPAFEEVKNIPWQVINDHRSNNPVFATSTSVHLRVHKPPPGVIPKTVDEWSSIVECRDNPYTLPRFPAVYSLAKWMYNQVNGIALGRIMIVNLEPGGHVAPHIDPRDYFEMYNRYHVPFKTNSQVLFSGGPNTEQEHMPLKVLSRLNNRLMHQLDNFSDENRIHLIVDIALEEGNQIF